MGRGMITALYFRLREGRFACLHSVADLIGKKLGGGLMSRNQAREAEKEQPWHVML